jgi:putative flippase GtrA
VNEGSGPQVPTLGVGFKPELSSQVRALFFEILGYWWVSIVALALDATLLQILVKWGRWPYLAASAVSFITGAVAAYLLSVRFVFQFRQVTNRLFELGYFVALGLVGLLVNAVVLSIAIGALGLGLLTAKLISAGCTFTTNFMLRRRLLFSPARMPE